ncbi:MAG: hypothetical protein JO112_18030 [Planctomycetes bacterium]|nr:hypothetical protein [Planctomycetota bacterium]
MKIGDVSRGRRFADPARLRWYAYHRSVRFALRMRQELPASVGRIGNPSYEVYARETLGLRSS